MTSPAAAEPATQAGTPALPLAGLGRRLGALTYELLLLTALVFVAGFALLPLVTPARGGSELAVPDLPARVAVFCALFATIALYLTWSWSAGRRTLAQKTWRLALVAVDGRPLDYRRAFVRYLAGWIGPALALATYVTMRPYGLGGVAVVPLALNYLAAFVDPGGQFLHDRIAGTRIVQGR